MSMERLLKSERLGTAIGTTTLVAIASAFAIDPLIHSRTPIKIPKGAKPVATMSGAEGYSTLIKTTSARQLKQVDCGNEGGFVKTENPRQEIGRFVICSTNGETPPAIVTITK